jgi:hypothetical protein
MTLEYSFVDDNTGKQEEESKNFVVSGIIKSTGNPTIDDAIVINLDAGNTLLQKAGKYDALFVTAASSNFVDAVEQEIRNLYGNDIGITTVEAILKTVRVHWWYKRISHEYCCNIANCGCCGNYHHFIHFGYRENQRNWNP